MLGEQTNNLDGKIELKPSKKEFILPTLPKKPVTRARLESTGRPQPYSPHGYTAQTPPPGGDWQDSSW